MKIRNLMAGSAAAVLAAAAGCSSTPARIDSVETARSAVQQVESSPDAGKYAANEVGAAHDALRTAEELAEKGKPRKQIEEAAYLAQRHADIAAEQIARGQAEEKTAAAENERQRVVLQAREQEAAAARAKAEQESLAARADADQARQAAIDNARLAEQNAANASANLAALQDQLRDLQARQTDRGLVLTLGDVLFDTGKATLKPGAYSTVDRLAAFLKDAADRSVTIEGHTDSVGTDEYNMVLSEERASGVRAALLSRGIAGERVVAVGKGEGMPVASNDNAAGRQQNRRVEIIVSNPPLQSAPVVSGR